MSSKLTEVAEPWIWTIANVLTTVLSWLSQNGIFIPKIFRVWRFPRSNLIEDTSRSRTFIWISSIILSKAPLTCLPITSWLIVILYAASNALPKNFHVSVFQNLNGRLFWTWSTIRGFAWHFVQKRSFMGTLILFLNHILPRRLKLLHTTLKDATRSTASFFRL